MIVCRDCFRSPALRRLFVEGQAGRCSLCEQDHHATLSADKLISLFGPFLRDNYVRQSVLFEEGPFADLMPCQPLAGVIQQDGLKVFTADLDPSRRGAFLDRMLGGKSPGAQRGWWFSRIGAEFGYSEEWQKFSELVRYQRRYLTAGAGRTLLALFKSDNPAFTRKMAATTVFFRARIWEDAMSPPHSKDLEAPIPKKARAGRANPAGIPVLYVAGEEETAVAEVRPHLGAAVALGKVTCTKSLKVFDCTAEPRMEGLDPFARTFAREQKTARLVSALNREFAEPVAPNDAELDYVPTQAVAEMIQEQGYHGIKYRSAMRAGGYNYAFFEPKEFLVEYSKAVKVNATILETEPHDPAQLQRMALTLMKEKPMPSK